MDEVTDEDGTSRLNGIQARAIDIWQVALANYLGSSSTIIQFPSILRCLR